MDTVLDPVEVRVLGALLEKEITTPEYYPLTLNALTNACNQKSNRDPLVSYEDGDVLGAIDSLREKKLALTIIPSGSRVHKYSHRISEAFNLGRREMAVFCSLMLRGAQTLGELHSRSERMHQFTDLSEVESVLERLMTFEPPLAVKLPKLPGTKEPRYTHLLCGEPLMPAVEERADAPRREDRIAALEADVAQLRSTVAELQAKFEEFRGRFD